MSGTTTRRPTGRVAVTVLFLLAGTTTGSWAGRIPSVKAQVGASDGVWGLLLLGAPIGSLLALAVVAATATRFPPRRAALVGATALITVTPISAAQHVALALPVTLLVQGAAAGLLFGPMNALAVRVQHELGRSVLSGFHAWFSAGQLTGALLGAAAGALQIAPWLQIATSSVLLAGALVLTARRLPAGGATPAPPSAAEAVRGRRLPPALLLLAVLALLTSLNEGTATQWSAQYAVSRGAPIAVGSIALACFSISIATVRLVGDRVIDRLGPVLFLRLSAAVSAVGLGAALAIGTVPAAMVGFALLGIGSGCVMPVVFAATGRIGGVPPARGAAVVSIGEWPAFLITAPVVGALAQLAGLRAALVLVVLSATAIVLLAGRVRAPQPEPVRPGAA